MNKNFTCEYYLLELDWERTLSAHVIFPLNKHTYINLQAHVQPTVVVVETSRQSFWSGGISRAQKVLTRMSHGIVREGGQANATTLLLLNAKREAHRFPFCGDLSAGITRSECFCKQCRLHTWLLLVSILHAPERTCFKYNLDGAKKQYMGDGVHLHIGGLCAKRGSHEQRSSRRWLRDTPKFQTGSA